MSATAARVVRIRLLGGFAIEVDGRPVPEARFATRRALELVQLLALAPDRAPAGDRVVEALWPHLDAAAGRANLRKAAHHARAALGHADSVVLRGGRVLLFPHDAVDVDVARFRALAHAALATGDVEACARAADAHDGELLPASPYEEWTFGPRDELRSLHHHVLAGAGRWRDLVAADPLHEAAHQELMRDALRHGARAEAIRWYEHLRGALQRELGVGPDAITQALYAQCLHGLDGARDPFVGRADELATVASLERHVAAGAAAACVLVEGVPGSGRSAFVAECARRAADAGWQVVGPVLGTPDGAYGTLARVVDAVLADGPGPAAALDDHRRAVLRALTPAVGPAPALRGPNSRHQVIGAVARLLVAAGGGAPVLLVVDDAHLADDASADALVALASGPGPLLVALTATDPVPSTLAAGLDRLVRAGRARPVHLGPLSATEAARLVARVLGEEPSPPDLTTIVAHAAGSPAIVRALAETLRRGGTHALGAHAADLAARPLAALDPPTRDVLARLALAGPEVDAVTALALAGDEQATFAALDAALEAGILGVVAGRYRFRDDAARDALLAGMAPHHRVAVHGAAVDRLVAVGAPAATIARHALAAGRPADAVPWLLRGARESFAAGAFANACRDADLVLAHEPANADARRVRAEALDAQGDVGALGAYDAAIAAAPPDDVDDLRAARALAQIKMGDAPGALAAIAGVRPRSVHGRLCEALTYSGAAALGFADPALGTEKSAAARRLAIETGDQASIVIASWSQAAAAHARGELRDSVLADLRDTKDLPHLAVRVFDGHLCFTQRFLYGSRPYDDVIAFADGLAAEAVRLGAARGHAFGVQLRGEAELLSGRLAEAETDLLEGGRLHRAIAGAVGEAHALQRLAELEMLRGAPARAANLLDEALDVARATDIGFHLLDRIYGTRIALAATLDPAAGLVAVDEAEAAVRGPLETCPGCRITFAMPAGIACARAGAIERAVEYERINTYLAGVVMRLPAWDAALAELRGHLARATGDERAAATAFVAAAEGFAVAGQPFDEARCRAHLAEVSGNVSGTRGRASSS